MARSRKKERVHHLSGLKKQETGRTKKLKIFLREKRESLAPEAEVVEGQGHVQLQSYQPFRCQLKQNEPIQEHNK